MKKTIIIFIITSLTILLNLFYVNASSETFNMTYYLEKFESINKTLLKSSNKKTIDSLTKQRETIIEEFIDKLKKQPDDIINFSNFTTKISILEDRIDINNSMGNTLAVARDKTDVDINMIKIRMLKFFSFLIQARNTFTTKKDIINKAEDELSWLKSIIIPKIPKSDKNNVYNDLKENNLQFKIISSTYSGILYYVIDHPERIAVISWVYYFKLETLIAVINNSSKLIREINGPLSPINMSIGKLAVTIFLFLIVFFVPLVIKKLGVVIKRLIVNLNFSSNKVEIYYNEIQKPIKLLIIFFGINIPILVLFMNTGVEKKIMTVNYIVYTCLIAHLFFKIIDGTAIIRLEQLSNHTHLREEFINLFIKFAKFIVLVLMVSLGLNHYGIKMTAILSTLGLGGLAFALAAKDTLSNFFGGITILMDDLFRQGDWIKLKDVEGTVVEIGIRSTTVRSFANAFITVPNSVVANQHVVNWNRREVGRRVKMHINVAYECKIEDFKNAVEDIRYMLTKHPGVAQPTSSLSNYKRRISRLLSLEGKEGIKEINQAEPD
ncbi:MAG: hypothetical protein B6I31_00620 [Desulfobacteraceae bacterium 4572_19]|nr:MAG: hypothetical protein B6I31_00620 [Desulfobacteraceae bacterium 4572_19]